MAKKLKKKSKTKLKPLTNEEKEIRLMFARERLRLDMQNIRNNKAEIQRLTKKKKGRK